MRGRLARSQVQTPGRHDSGVDRRRDTVTTSTVLLTHPPRHHPREKGVKGRPVLRVLL